MKTFVSTILALVVLASALAPAAVLQRAIAAPARGGDALQVSAGLDYNADGVINDRDLVDFARDIAPYLSTPAPASATPTPSPSSTLTAEPTATVTPTSEPTGTATPEPTASVTSTPEPTATATPTSEPTSTATPEPTPTPTEHVHVALDACGNSAAVWHAPCLHDHGHPAPAWLTAAGVVPAFDHMHGTGPAENSAKHAFMKGVRLFDKRAPYTIEAYGVFHGSGVAQERVGQFHSAQLWIRDSAGGISYLSWWNDYGKPCIWKAGDPANGCGRMRTFADFDARPPNTGAIRIIDGQQAEQWYPVPSGAKPDMPMLFQSGERFSWTEVYTPGVTSAPALGPGQWITGNLIALATTRRFYEALLYEGRIASIPTDAPVLMSQFGQAVTAAQCASATSMVTYAGAAYRLQCATWHITAQLRVDLATRPIEFGQRLFRLDNRDEQTFTTAGVSQPN